MHTAPTTKRVVELLGNEFQDISVWPTWATIHDFRGDNAQDEDLSGNCNPVFEMEGDGLGLQDIEAGIFNQMEVRATITPDGVSALGKVQFEFTRTVVGRAWAKNAIGDPWQDISEAAGLDPVTPQNDDATNKDEDLHDGNDVIWSTDSTGQGGGPAPVEFMAVETNFSQTIELLLDKDPNTVNPINGPSISDEFKWNSILNLKEDGEGNTSRNTDRKNQIKQGVLTIGTNPQ